jgi:hypothetical protein
MSTPFTSSLPYSEAGFQHKIDGEGERIKIGFMEELAILLLLRFHTVYKAGEGNTMCYQSRL